MKISDDQILLWLRDERTINKGFIALMNAYQERLYQQVFRIMSSHDDTDDVLQNVFIKVFKSIQRFEGRSGLYTWLYRIAYNESITAKKKIRSRHALSIDDEDSATVHQITASLDIDGDKVEKALLEAITRLPEKQKQVFEMRYYDEMPYQQMSDELGTSVGGLKASYHHAVKKIEHFLTLNANYES